ncbi:MAG: hypothetical protein AB7O59_10045 [Pirellulales bacterium]
MDRPHSLKRPLLYALVASVILAVVLGISIVLRNQWSWFEVRVILTTLTITAASICGLACDLSRSLKGHNLLSRAGMLLTGIAAVLLLYGMWADVNWGNYWKTTAVASTFAVASAHICMLSIARLAKRFRWVFPVAVQVIYGLASLIAVMIVWEIHGARSFQIIAALSILSAGMTLLIPILHRISKTDPTTPAPLTLFDEKNVAAIDAEIAQLQRRILELEKLRAGIVGTV